jgi:hypothetical protein
MPMPIEDEQVREALNAHWHALAVSDTNAEHDICADDAICDYPQSGERILGRGNLQALGSHHPDEPSASTSGEFSVKRLSLDHGIHNHIPGARLVIHGEHYGVPQRRGRARETVLRGPSSRRRHGGGNGFSRSRDAAPR